MFGFEVPAGDLGYQLRTEVHVIGEFVHSSLTPELKPPPIVIKRKVGKVEIFFDFDSAVVRKGEEEKLRKVRGRVSVVGHASPEGGEEYNLKLSKERAKNVAEKLKKMGIQVLEIKGMGEKSCSLKPSLWHKCRKAEIKPFGG